MSKMFAQTLINHFKSMLALDRDDCHTLHKATLNILRVLLCDFPEFLCEYHYEFIGAMSPQCIQMLNLISCAFPRNMHMPDPLTPGLKVDTLPEIQQHPQISPIYVKMIELTPFKQLNDPNCCFSVPLIVQLCFMWELRPLINSKDLRPSVSTIAKSSHSKFFSNLIYRLDHMGMSSLLLTAMCNQLTYPNSHTQYFSCLLQYLFLSIIGERAHREIASVVLERLTFKPYPWGLAITAVKLIKNPLFELHTRDFFCSSPVIET